MPLTRLHEDPPPFTTLEGYELDLWRLIHSQAFRSLATKSYFPSLQPERPTPTIMSLAVDASHFARTLARRLQLNQHLTECLLAARLLGLPAGGHYSLRVLSRLMHKQGGFSLVAQSLRIVDELETVFPEFNGLNLTWDVRHALGASPSQALRTYKELAPDRAEHAVAAFATRLSNLQLDLLHLPATRRDSALQGCALWKNIQASIAGAYPHLESKRLFSFTLHQFLLRLLEECSLTPSNQIVTLSTPTEGSLQDLEHRLHHENKSALETCAMAKDLEAAITSLFSLFVNRQQLIPEKLALRIKKDGAMQVACDYLITLSDQQLFDLYHHHARPTPSAGQADRRQMELI